MKKIIISISLLFTIQSFAMLDLVGLNFPLGEIDFNRCDSLTPTLNTYLSLYYSLEDKLESSKESLEQLKVEREDLKQRMYSLLERDHSAGSVIRLQRIIYLKERNADLYEDELVNIANIQANLRSQYDKIERPLKAACTESTPLRMNSLICELRSSNRNHFNVSTNKSLSNVSSIILGYGSRVEFLRSYRVKSESLQKKVVFKLHVLSNNLNDFFGEKLAIPGDIVFVSKNTFDNLFLCF